MNQSLLPPKPDALELVQYRTGIVLFPMAALAVFAVWWIMGEKNTPLDSLVMPPLGAFLILLELGLLRGWASPRAIWVVGLASCSCYLVASLCYEIARGDYYPGLPAGTYWLMSVYIFTFFMVRLEHTMRFSVIYFLVTVGALIIGAALAPQRGELFVNSCVQLVLSNSFMVVLLHLYSKIRGRYVEMQQFAHTDVLTRLANRRFAEASIERIISQANSRQDGFSFILIDVDHFKRINDTHGHRVGDQVLQELAVILSSNARENDILARWGGEEFLLLAPGRQGDQVTQFAERLRSRVSELRVVRDVAFTISLGIATYRDNDTMDTLLARADKALYQAKSNGRNRVESDVDMTERTVA